MAAMQTAQRAAPISVTFFGHCAQAEIRPPNYFFPPCAPRGRGGTAAACRQTDNNTASAATIESHRTARAAASDNIPPTVQRRGICAVVDVVRYAMITVSVSQRSIIDH